MILIIERLKVWCMTIKRIYSLIRVDYISLGYPVNAPSKFFLISLEPSESIAPHFEKITYLFVLIGTIFCCCSMVFALYGDCTHLIWFCTIHYPFSIAFSNCIHIIDNFFLIIIYW